jgi:hypothetical protein
MRVTGFNRAGVSNERPDAMRSRVQHASTDQCSGKIDLRLVGQDSPAIFAISQPLGAPPLR